MSRVPRKHIIRKLHWSWGGVGVKGFPNVITTELHSEEWRATHRPQWCGEGGVEMVSADQTVAVQVKLQRSRLLTTTSHRREVGFIRKQSVCLASRVANLSLFRLKIPRHGHLPQPHANWDVGQLKSTLWFILMNWFSECQGLFG